MKLTYVMLGLAFLMAAVFAVVSQSENEVAVEAEPVVVSTPSPLAATSTFGYPVVGIVTADKEFTITARTAGTVNAITVAEGDQKAAGEFLLLSVNPVVAAQSSRQEIASALALAAAKRGELASVGAASLGQVAYAGAQRVAELASTAEATAVTTADELLSSTLSGTAASLAPTLRFIEENKSRFPAEALKLYEAVVVDLYGRETNYFSVSGLSAGQTGEGLLARLATVEASSTDQEAVARELALTLGQLTRVFTLAEEDFLDRTKLSSDDARYEAYNEARGDLATLSANITSGLSAVTGSVDAGRIGEMTRVTEVGQAAVAAKVAGEDTELASLVKDLTANLGAADISVMAAELGLGLETAPFPGVVTKVFVAEGQSVMPGTPLLSYVSADEQELAVSMSPALLPYLAVGTPFVVAGEVVGEVDRFVPVTVDGSVSVFIRFTKPFPIGATVTGELILTTANSLIERSELFFGSTGPYVVTESGEKVRVSIVFDGGEHLLVVPASPLALPLKKALGLRL